MPATQSNHNATEAQLKRYAEDLSRVYQSEKEKRIALGEANAQLVQFARDLKSTIKDLKYAYLDTINRLALAAELKDEDTGDHINRLSRYSELIAKGLGMPGHFVDNLRHAAPMHDVGKIGIPDKILMHPGKLSAEEFDLMKTHTTIGGKILENSKAEILQVARQIALYHHEKFNGKGYPEGIAGEDIPLEARIVGLVDVFDALTSSRPYKDPYPVEIANRIIVKERGKHFDPDIVDVFQNRMDDVIRIKNEVKSPETVCIGDMVYSERDMAAQA